MKAVMISVRPGYCEKILNREKTLEWRKNRPRTDGPFKVYVYCTKSKKYFVHNGIGESLDDLYRLPDGQIKYGYSGELMCCDGQYGPNNFLNGKVIAEFICNGFIPCEVNENSTITNWMFHNMEKRGCVPYEELAAYIGPGKTGFGWIISDLKIYDQPKSLREFRPEIETHQYYHPPLSKAPQSWCYVEELEESK